MLPSRPTHRPRPLRRRGALLILVMICLLAITALAGTLLKLAVAQHRQSRLQERHLQAEWLAAAAIDRGTAQLANDPAWTGETWTLPVAVVGEAAAAVVHVEPVADAAGVIELTAVASVGNGDPPAVRATRKRRVNVGNPDPSGGTP